MGKINSEKFGKTAEWFKGCNFESWKWKEEKYIWMRVIENKNKEFAKREKAAWSVAVEN